MGAVWGHSPLPHLLPDMPATKSLTALRKATCPSPRGSSISCFSSSAAAYVLPLRERCRTFAYHPAAPAGPSLSALRMSRSDSLESVLFCNRSSTARAQWLCPKFRSNAKLVVSTFRAPSRSFLIIRSQVSPCQVPICSGMDSTARWKRWKRWKRCSAASISRRDML